MKEKYFCTLGKRRWVFFGEADGERHYLRTLSRTPIRRHIKVRAKANPYDPQWEYYFERRLALTMEQTLGGNVKHSYSGRSKRAAVLCASTSSPTKRVGTTITWSGAATEGKTRLIIACYFTRNAISRCIRKGSWW